MSPAKVCATKFDRNNVCSQPFLAAGSYQACQCGRSDMSQGIVMPSFELGNRRSSHLHSPVLIQLYRKDHRHQTFLVSIVSSCAGSNQAVTSVSFYCHMPLFVAALITSKGFLSGMSPMISSRHCTLQLGKQQRIACNVNEKCNELCSELQHSSHSLTGWLIQILCLCTTEANIVTCQLSSPFMSKPFSL